MDPRVSVLKTGFDIAHMVFLSVISDLTEKTSTYTIPDGNVPSAVAFMAHALYGEDMIVNKVARSAEMVIDRGDFKSRTGNIAPSPAMTVEWLENEFDLEGLRDYAAAVFEQTANFLNSVSTAELDRKVASPIGSEVTVAELLVGFSVVHLAVHAGEISTLKGAQMLKGLPF